MKIILLDTQKRVYQKLKVVVALIVMLVLIENLVHAKKDKQPNAQTSEQSDVLKTKPQEKKLHEIGLFFEYDSADNFNSKRYGMKSMFTMFDVPGVTFSSYLNADHRITNTDTYFPDNIVNIEYSLNIQNRNIWIRSSVRSKSDKPFNSVDELRYYAWGLYDVLDSRSHSFFVGLMYFSQITFLNLPNIPYPLIVYQYRSKDLFFMGPIPLVLNWKISNDFSLNLSYHIETAKISFKYHVTPDIYIAPEAYWIWERMFMANRVNKDEELILENGKAGIRFSYSVISAFFGHSFTGRYYNIINDSKSNVVDVDNSFVMDVEFKFSF